MIEQNRNPERDDVLLAFHQTCDNPTAEQVSEWTRQYPQYADDIRAHAVLRAQWASDSDEHGPEPDESMLARGRSGSGTHGCAPVVRGEFLGPAWCARLSDYTKALSPVIALPTIRFCIWNVPS